LARSLRMRLDELGVSGWTELAGIAAGVSWALCNGNEEGKAWDLF
jgi:hypothetical protein